MTHTEGCDSCFQEDFKLHYWSDMSTKYVNHQTIAWWVGLNTVWDYTLVHYQQHCDPSCSACCNICLQPSVHSNSAHLKNERALITESRLWLQRGSDLLLSSRVAAPSIIAALHKMINSSITCTRLSSPCIRRNPWNQAAQIRCYSIKADVSSRLHIDTSCSPTGWSWC